MKRTKTKEPIKTSSIFKCLTCNSEQEFDGAQQVKEHLEKVHSLTEFKGKRSMVSHIDCADSFHSTFEWEIGPGPIKLVQFTSNPRQKNDPMRFND